MEEYRKLAQQKYQLQKQQAEVKEVEEKKEKERLERELETEQLRIAEEAERMEQEQLDRIQFVLNMWDELGQLFPIPMSSVQELTDHIQQTYHLFQQYDRMDEVRERTVQLVETVNTQHELIPHTNDDIRHVHQVMKTLLETCGVDVPIEVMDVSQDETMAKRIQDELFHDEPPMLTIQDAFHTGINNIVHGTYMNQNPYVQHAPFHFPSFIFPTAATIPAATIPSPDPTTAATIPSPDPTTAVTIHTATETTNPPIAPTDRPMSVLATMLQQLQQMQHPVPVPGPGNDGLAICSVTKRIGLTVPQLKEIARTHRLSQQGTKEDLCRRLQQAGLVQIV